MKAVDVVVLLDAILMAAMGVLGFIRKHSVPSLAAGVIVGALLVGTLFLAKSNPRVARIAAAVIALLPLGQFVPKFLKEPEVYPGGLVIAGGLFTFAFLLGSHFVAMSRRKSTEM